MIITNYKFKAGQSFFEVVFAIGITALILVAVVSLATKSLANSDFSKNNALALRHVQEASEWVRQQRDLDWTNLTSRTPGSSIALGVLSWGAANPISGGIFSRFVDLSYATTVLVNDTVVVTLRVSWQDAKGVHEVRSVGRYTDWR